MPTASVASPTDILGASDPVLVYGDRSEQVDPQLRLDELDRSLRAIEQMPDGLARHSALTDVLIETGRVLQGIADAEFATQTEDRESNSTADLAEFLQGIAEEFVRSWQGRFKPRPRLGRAPKTLRLPDTVELRVPEGYAHYALYPEAYLEAAKSLALSGKVRVIGLRSIGTSLAAVAAAAVGASRPITVRPFGPEYERRIAMSSELADKLLEDRDAHFLIVDEGPGQSGSSFGAVADWLEERGVSEQHIIFLPSHAGEPGPHASVRHRERWQRARKKVASFERRLPMLLAEWSDADCALENISHGQWRRRVFEDQAEWPAVDSAWEKQKFLLQQGRTRLLKFAGLGGEGFRKLQRAKILHQAGFAPEPLGLVHGFLVEQWHEDAKRLSLDETPLARVAEYIGTRARLLPAEHGDGASLDKLLKMAKRNVALALDEVAAKKLDGWSERLPRLQSRIVPSCTDNRLDRHEWLLLTDGRLLKADGVDHCQAHDLIGCQDVSWDVAGAAVEFDLSEQQTKWLAGEVGRVVGRRIDPELLHFMTIAYLAFRLGQSVLSCEISAGEPAEEQRLGTRAHFYREHLSRTLHQRTSSATPRISSLDAAGERLPKEQTSSCWVQEEDDVLLR